MMLRPGGSRCLRIMVFAFLFLPGSKMASLNSPIFINSSISGPSDTSLPFILEHSQGGTQLREYVVGGRYKEEKGATDPTSFDYTINDYSRGVEENPSAVTESCMKGITCDEFSQLTPPPFYDIIDLVPPPPLPLFLFEPEIMQRWVHDGTAEGFRFELLKDFHFKKFFVMKTTKDGAPHNVVVRINPKWLSTDHFAECSLCEWASGNRSTDTLFAIRNKSLSTANSLISWRKVLISVAFISAILGASLTCILLKIRNLKRLKSTAHVDCHSSATGIKTTNPSETQRCPESNRSVTSVPKMFCGHFMNADNNMKCSVNDIPPKVKCYEPVELSSTTEELYLNAHSLCATCSDLTSYKDSITREKNTFLSKIPAATYSDPSNISLKTYSVFHRNEFAMGVPSHIVPNYSSTSDSSSAFSSAYYSDVSSCEVQPSRRKKENQEDDLDKQSQWAVPATSVGRSRLPIVQSISNCVQLVPNHVHASCSGIVRPVSSCLCVSNFEQTVPRHLCSRCKYVPKVSKQGLCLPHYWTSLSNCIQQSPNFLLMKNRTSNNLATQNSEQMSVIINKLENKVSSSENSIGDRLLTNNNIVLENMNNNQAKALQSLDKCITVQDEVVKNHSFHTKKSLISKPLKDVPNVDHGMYIRNTANEIPAEYI